MSAAPAARTAAARAPGPLGAVPPALAAYLAASAAAGPLVRPWLAWRARAGHEDAGRLGERLGRASLPRPEGPLVWIHGASLGETIAALPLIAALGRRRPELRFLVTAGTRAAATVLPGRLPPGAVHQYAPVDTSAAVGAFLDHWRPDLAIRVESELWPRQLAETAARGVPMALVNARLSARSAWRWRRAPATARVLLGWFALVQPADPDARAALCALGVEPARLAPPGELKALLPAPPADPQALAAARAALAGRPCWLALATHGPEEEAVVAAQRLAGARLPGLLAILVPRHVERADAIAAALAADGLRTARRSRGELPDASTEVWLADTLGEAGLWLALAPVVFIGGTLAPIGGHSPFEAIAAGAALLHGPHTGKAPATWAALEAAGGARRVADAADLAAAISALLTDPSARVRMNAAAGATARALAPDVAGLAAALTGLVGRVR